MRPQSNLLSVFQVTIESLLPIFLELPNHYILLNARRHLFHLNGVAGCVSSISVSSHPHSLDFTKPNGHTWKFYWANLSELQDGEERRVAYASKILSKSERNYCVTREDLSIEAFIKHFRPFLYGCWLLVRTNHSSLKWLLRFEDLEGQLARGHIDI